MAARWTILSFLVLAASVCRGQVANHSEAYPTLVERQRLVAADTWPTRDSPAFGSSSSFVGDALFIAAPADSRHGYNSAGAVYRFVRDPETGLYEEAEKILSPGPFDGFSFGGSAGALDAAGDRPALYAASERGKGGIGVHRAGVVWVYARDPLTGTWAVEALLQQVPGVQDARLGTRMAVDASAGRAQVLAVTDHLDTVIPDQALFFERDDETGTWAEVARLTAPALGPTNGKYGESVALLGDFALVGAPTGRLAPTGPRNGVALLYRRDATTREWVLDRIWESHDPPYPDPTYGHALGFRVALVGDPEAPTALVYSNGHNVQEGQPRIAVFYSYRLDPATGDWKEDVLRQPDRSWGFGRTTASARSPAGDLLAVSAPDEHVNGSDRAGTVYVYLRPTGASRWDLIARLLPTTRASCCDNFGSGTPAVTSDGLVVVGRTGEWIPERNDRGAAYVFDIGPLLPVSSENGPGPVSAVTIETIWPNPSSSSASVGYRLGAAGAVVVSVLDLLGREVRRVVEREQSAGWHGALIETGGLAPGVYAVRVEAGGSRAVRRLVVAR